MDIEIFRAGTYPQGEFTEADLDDMVRAYDPKLHEAPVTLDHARSGPAYGWVAGLQRQGKVLVASFRDVADELKRLVADRRYVKRSAEVYNNFQGTGKKYLRAVTFLGAQVPEVKGLRDVAFAEAGGEFVSVEFSESWFYRLVADGFRSLREAFIADKGQDAADKILPGYIPDELTAEAARLAVQQPEGPTFAEADAKKAQAARAKKWGIAVKEGGNVGKPGEWKDVADADFLDPVNYRYPCPDADQTKAAAAYWGKEANKAQYSSEERGVIDKRLEGKMKQFKMGDYAKHEEDEMQIAEFKEKVRGRFTAFLKGRNVEATPKEIEAVIEEPGVTVFSEADVAAARKQAEEAGEKKAEAKLAVKRREGEIKSFCEAGVKDGKLAPAWVKAGLPDFMGRLDAAEVVEFGEEKAKKSLAAWFQEFLEGLPELIKLEEVASAAKDIPHGAGTAGAKLEALVAAKLKEDKALTYAAAFNEVCTANTALAAEYAADLTGGK